MIRFENHGVSLDGTPVLHDVELTVTEGSLHLVTGATGSGKSTLLRSVNGLVPHFSGGEVTGRVLVDGRDIADHRPRDLAEVVGFVDQNPTAAFVTEHVEDEIAYAMESLGVARPRMRRRVEETLDLLGIAPLRHRPLRTLSGGEQQRVAVAAVVAAGPRIVVLDEPTSALDPVAAEEVLATLARLVHDLGFTVLLAEHRLERVVHLADDLTVVTDGRARTGAPGVLLRDSPGVPPVVQFGRGIGLDPLPLSVRDTRRATTDLRSRLRPAPAAPTAPPGPALLAAERLDVTRGRHQVLRQVSLTLAAGRIVALTGRNGSGKTTLLSALAGLVRPASGRVTTDARVALVPQDPSLILYADSLAAEGGIADRDAGVAPGATLALWRRLLPGGVAVPDSRHPRDLSEGQRLALALAVVLATDPQVVLLDEPTRGLDYTAKDLLVTWLRELADRGCAVLLATHDVELVAEVADRVVTLGEAEVVADRPARQALVDSLAFAPQLAKVMHPLPVLTAAEALAAARRVEP